MSQFCCMQVVYTSTSERGIMDSMAPGISAEISAQMLYLESECVVSWALSVILLKKMFKSLLLWFLFSFGTLASAGVWLVCLPVQFSMNICGLSTSYVCRSELREWLPLHKLRSLWRVDFWPFSFAFYQIWFWTFFPSICHIQFSDLFKFWCGFGVERCSVCRRAVSGFAEHLFLYTKWASEHFRHMSEFWYVFFFLPVFPYSGIAVLSSCIYCQGINVLCWHTLGMVKGQSLRLFSGVRPHH